MKNDSYAASFSLNHLFGRGLLVLLVALPLIAPPLADAQAHRYRLRINNHSRYAIHRIYMSSAESNQWGRDLLGDGVLAPNGAFTLTDIVSGEWDIRLVDRYGHACILTNVEVFENLSLDITTDWLLNCQRSGNCQCRDDGQ